MELKTEHIIILLFIFVLIFVAIRSLNRSAYVRLETEFPETGIINTVCRCTPLMHDEYECEYKGLKKLKCPDGREYCCTSDRRICMWEACRIPW